MGPGGRGVVAGVFVGLALVVLLQQFGYVSLSGFPSGIEWLALGAGILGFMLGLVAHLRARTKPKGPLSPWPGEKPISAGVPESDQAESPAVEPSGIPENPPTE